MLFCCYQQFREFEKSAEAEIGPQVSGALTAALMSTIEANSKLSYEDLLASLRNFMKTDTFQQTPQLCTGYPIDITDLFRL